MIAGVDFSSFTIDVVLLDETTDEASHTRLRLDTGPGKALDRVRRVRDVLPARANWRDTGITLVAIEEPFHHSHQGLAPLLMVLGAILSSLPREMPLALLRADDWRRTLQLPLRKTDHKANSVAFAREHWTDAPARFDHNAGDAFCVAWAARELERKREQVAA